jgi:hypothetical protein
LDEWQELGFISEKTAAGIEKRVFDKKTPVPP